MKTSKEHQPTNANEQMEERVGEPETPPLELDFSKEEEEEVEEEEEEDDEERVEPPPKKRRIDSSSKFPKKLR